MVERSDRAKDLQAMIFSLLNIISVVLLIAAFLISVVSWATIVRFFLFGKRESSTCFFFTCALCIISVTLHSKPIPTWFRIVGIIIVSITTTEVTVKMIKLMLKKIMQWFGSRQVTDPRSEND